MAQTLKQEFNSHTQYALFQWRWWSSFSLPTITDI